MGKNFFFECHVFKELMTNRLSRRPIGTKGEEIQGREEKGEGEQAVKDKRQSRFVIVSSINYYSSYSFCSGRRNSNLSGRTTSTHSSFHPLDEVPTRVVEDDRTRWGPTDVRSLVLNVTCVGRWIHCPVSRVRLGVIRPDIDVVGRNPRDV